MFPHCKLNEPDVNQYLATIGSADIKNTLSKQKLTFTDFLTLLSPAAGEHLDEMRFLAKKVKQMHFGKTIRLYSPLYISNYCINDCEYCGFRTSHREEKRRRLSLDELVAEAETIRDYGITSLLLVSGEDPKAISIDYLEKAAKVLKEMFAYVSIEIYPMPESDYRRLFKAGIHGITLYQETYNQQLYDQLHHAGPKKDYLQRIKFLENAGRAGFYNMGLGVLLGLYDWRIEAASLAAHGLWLKKHFWRSKIQFSFPRITPIAGGFDVPAPVCEAELEQMMLAFRLFFQESDLYISTRESAAFRDNVAQTCASHFSAASRVIPGGYVVEKEDDLGQFTLNDNRSVEQIRKDFKKLDLELVFKDWDECFGIIPQAS